MDLFKIIDSGNKVFIKILTCNERVWSEHQWAYRYVREAEYPTSDEQYATDFKKVEAAEQWIKENSPN